MTFEEETGEGRRMEREGEEGKEKGTKGEEKQCK